MTATIDLDAADMYEVRGQTIWMDNGTHEVVVRIPKSQKVTLHKHRANRATLNIGTFNKIVLSVAGPTGDINSLFKSLTDTPPTK